MPLYAIIMAAGPLKNRLFPKGPAWRTILGLTVAALAIGLSFWIGLQRGPRGERPRSFTLDKDPVFFDEHDQPSPLSLLGDSSPVLILVLRSDCIYCDEVVDSWNVLLSLVANDQGVGLFVLSHSLPTETRVFLAKLRLPPRVRVLYVHRGGGRQLALRMTPTTLLKLPGTPEIRLWDGLLSDRDEEYLAAALH
jgi:hypothetical protein